MWGPARLARNQSAPVAEVSAGWGVAGRPQGESQVCLSLRSRSSGPGSFGCGLKDPVNVKALRGAVWYTESPGCWVLKQVSLWCCA